jgi:hypothetical protein
MRMARKPSAVARELLRNFPRSGGKRRRRRGRRSGGGNGSNDKNGGKEGNGEAAPRAESTDRTGGADSD